MWPTGPKGLPQTGVKQWQPQTWESPLPPLTPTSVLSAKSTDTSKGILRVTASYHLHCYSCSPATILSWIRTRALYLASLLPPLWLPKSQSERRSPMACPLPHRPCPLRSWFPLPASTFRWLCCSCDGPLAVPHMGQARYLLIHPAARFLPL